VDERALHFHGATFALRDSMMSYLRATKYKYRSLSGLQRKIALRGGGGSGLGILA